MWDFWKPSLHNTYCDLNASNNGDDFHALYWPQFSPSPFLYYCGFSSPTSTVLMSPNMQYLWCCMFWLLSLTPQYLVFMVTLNQNIPPNFWLNIFNDPFRGSAFSKAVVVVLVVLQLSWQQSEEEYITVNWWYRNITVQNTLTELSVCSHPTNKSREKNNNKKGCTQRLTNAHLQTKVL